MFFESYVNFAELCTLRIPSGTDQKGACLREMPQESWEITTRVDGVRCIWNTPLTLSLSPQVAELKQELKLRGLTVSGTKIDLIERLRNYQEQNGGGALKNGQSQAAQPLAHNATPAPNALHQSGEGLTRVPSFSLAQGPVPGRVMRFGSTSSSPPVSPTPSERSLAGMSPDETSCSGDTFGEMVRAAGVIE